VAFAKALCTILTDRLLLAKFVPSSTTTLPGGNLVGNAMSFFGICKRLIEEAEQNHMPRSAVEVSICFAQAAQLFGLYCKEDQIWSDEYVGIQEAKSVLEKAQILCKEPFQNAEVLGAAVTECLQSFQRYWYDNVTIAQVAAIKLAMVSSKPSTSIHSGDWYNCANGHLVSWLLSIFIRTSTNVFG